MLVIAVTLLGCVAEMSAPGRETSPATPTSRSSPQPDATIISVSQPAAPS